MRRKVVARRLVAVGETMMTATRLKSFGGGGVLAVGLHGRWWWTSRLRSRVVDGGVKLALPDAAAH